MLDLNNSQEARHYPGSYKPPSLFTLSLNYIFMSALQPLEAVLSVTLNLKQWHQSMVSGQATLALWEIVSNTDFLVPP